MITQQQKEKLIRDSIRVLAQKRRARTLLAITRLVIESEPELAPRPWEVRNLIRPPKFVIGKKGWKNA